MRDRAAAPGTGQQAVVLGALSLVGIAAFLYPFVLAAANDAGVEESAHAREAPFLLAIVTALSVVASLVTVGGDAAGTSRAKSVALLGVLVAVDATLRLIPGVLGASPIFALIILVGAVFGASLGFQMGALTLLLSAFITGGVGPWLPFQMFTAAWLGMTAGWLPRPPGRWRIAVLAVFGGVWGLLFGAIMNLWFWPLAAPGVDASSGLYWQPGLGLAETLARYSRFYLTTSLAFDVARAIGNVVLILAVGGPVVRLLERYHARFTWQPWVALEEETAAQRPVAQGPA